MLLLEEHDRPAGLHVEGTGCVLDGVADDIDDGIVRDGRGVGQGNGGAARFGGLKEGHGIRHVEWDR